MNVIGFKDYQIFRNGNQFVASFVERKKAERKLLSLGKRGVYVELWACYVDGSRYLLTYIN